MTGNPKHYILKADDDSITRGRIAGLYNIQAAEADCFYFSGDGTYKLPPRNEMLVRDFASAISAILLTMWDNPFGNLDKSPVSKEEVNKDIIWYAKTAVNLVKNHLADMPGVSSLSKNDGSKIITICCKCADAIDNKRSDVYQEALSKLLTITKKEKFITGHFSASTNPEAAFYVCPEALKNKLPFIESVLYGTGTAWGFYTGKPDFKPVPNADQGPVSMKGFEYILPGEDPIQRAATFFNCSPNDIEIL